ncbi:PucR family transcriptional regulator [Streptomyces cinereoruber]|uniref:PucR family transcriptional regulator n=1 Tax=Streptomyces cinereoruber TaxID=67260 RepID=UPI00362539AF
MSAYNTSQAGTNDEGLREHLIGSASRLEAEILQRLTAELPVYRKLPAEQLTGDVARMIRRSIHDFVQALRSGRMLGPEQLALLTSSATRRAEEGLPAEAIVSAYFLGARLCFDDIAAAAGPEDLPTVTAMYSLLLEYLQHVTTAVTAGYLQQMQITVGERHGARQLLLTSLLQGRIDEEAAREAGLPLPPGYLVLALAVGPHADEHTPGVDTNAAAMRKLRRLRTELALHSRGAALSSLTPDGGLILLPSDTDSIEYGPAHWDDARRFLTRLQRAAGATVLAAAVPALPGDVAEMSPVATELVDIATASARPPGLYRLEDLALEYQLSRPGPARAHVARLLDPLNAYPDLLLTLTAFLRHGLDRRATAEALNVHPNTVLYRLRKIVGLTGLDAANPADLPTLHAALTCHIIGSGTARPLPKSEGKPLASGAGSRRTLASRASGKGARLEGC